ncbi:MAG TPA: hypothetical protein VI462_00010 [Acidimicrobiia bacterium]
MKAVRIHQPVGVDGQPSEDAIGQVDLVVDMIGGDVLARSSAEHDRDDMRALYFIREPSHAQLVDDGKVRPRSVVYPLAETREAFAAGARRHPRDGHAAGPGLTSITRAGRAGAGRPVRVAAKPTRVSGQPGVD